MLRHIFALLVASLVLLAPRQASAFSLLGARASWMTDEVGLGTKYPSGVGGPMNLGEAYRFNMPVITYAYDASFLRYFGASGVAAIESAMKVLNDIPAADSMSTTLDEFPTVTLRHNATASALSIIDIKTTTLSFMLEQLGVAAPENYVFSIRAHWTDPAQQEHFSVINPNFDPVTLQQSSSINGYQFTYQIFQTDTAEWKAVNFPVNPLAPGFTTVANFAQSFASVGRGGSLANGFGTYFPALTREDIAAFRYMLSTTNYAVETLLPDVIASTGGAIGVSGGTSVGSGGIGGGSTGGFSGGFGEPWSPVFSVFAGGTGSANPPWSTVTVSTNVATNAVVVTAATTGLPRVVNALRPGVGRYKFVQIGYDSILGASTRPYLVTWLDRYVTNNTTRVQAVARQVTVPDVLFAAGDLGVINHIPIFTLVTADGYIDNSALNRVGGVQDSELAGPGVITSGKQITFSKLGHYYINTGATGQANGFLFGVWGSFDGSTNTPVLFPTGASLKEIEKLVLGGR